MYYNLSNRTDKEVGNVFPQVTCKSLELAHSIKFNEFAYFDSEIFFELIPKAKLTDILSQAAISADGLLINKKMKDLLNGFNLMKHRYYKCIIKDQKDVLHNYYWLHFNDRSFLTNIDYENSKFYTREFGFRKDDIFLTSYEDYLEKKQAQGKMGGIGSDFIKFNNAFDSLLDLFNIPLFGTDSYASEVLIKKLIDAKITGLSVEKTNIILI